MVQARLLRHFVLRNDRERRNGTISGREDGYIRLVGAGFSGTGCLGDEAARQGFRLYPRMKLHINLLSVIHKIEGLEIPSGKSSPLEFC